ncbi:polyhydroxyalkanoate synthesis repressor PhaR [Pseudomonas fluorescens]|uniref:Polyhydroxyalkanoate synthesis repressor PhaR n=1 Tax=Pseudomonas fluorescens TaxID=294 RepID=A0A0P8X9J9_PSEFL|nr:polyhydroxyalkanoate synthesis repressor PhaR [Pseudomonas fluorescens]KPU56492.1 polyhydroxyalkanoate synthesis repressor PhaR [Pseudomonas fluorescens]
MTDNSRNTTRLIKKYPNRRLYDTHTSSHLTLADIRQLVVDRIPFEVVDAKTGEDLTRSILLQVILEAESGGEPIFSTEMLMGIIQFYGPYQSVLGSYLDKSIQTVIDIQSQTGAQSSEAWSAFMHQQAPVMQDLMRQYVDQSKALYMNTQNLFGLFGAMPAGKPGAGGGPKKNDDGE